MQVSQVYLRAFGREATPEEIDLADDFVASQGLAAFCRVILNSNEFLYLQ